MKLKVDALTGNPRVRELLTVWYTRGFPVCGTKCVKVSVLKVMAKL